MAQTPNLGLTEEELTDHYNIERINDNYDIIDAFALEVRTAIQELRDAIADLQGGS